MTNSNNWPAMKGEYRSGDFSSSVAVVTCGSHLNDNSFIESGAAISGSCKTENLGVEKLVIHIVSNPNIRFLIVTGTEVKGHITGEAILMLHQNGISENRIVGAKGAIPYIENLSSEAIERFRKQVECIDLINIEDESVIISKIKECVSKNPGPFPGDPILISEKGTGTQKEPEEPGSSTNKNIETVGFSSNITEEIVSLRLKLIDLELKNVGNLQKFKAGYKSGKIIGFAAGFILSVIVFFVLLFAMAVY